MKSFLKWLVIVVVALVVGLVLARNFIARETIEIGATRMTGFPLQVGAVSVGLLNGQVDAHEIKLMNPPDYPDQRFVDMPELFIDYRLRSMIAGTPHINDMLVNIKQLVIVKTAKGDSNAMKLKGVVSGGNSKSKYRVDRLRVHVGTVTIKDFSRGAPTEKNMSLNVDATYKDITDSTDISRLVLLTVMSQVRLPDIGINSDDLKKGLGNVQNAAGQALKGAGDALQNATKGLFDSLNQSTPQKH